jgi:deoxyribose-phosphate aldolase
MDDLRLKRASVSPRVKVKAAGGIRTLELLVEGLNAGMDRCGATATAAIIDDLRTRQGR